MANKQADKAIELKPIVMMEEAVFRKEKSDKLWKEIYDGLKDVDIKNPDGTEKKIRLINKAEYKKLFDGLLLRSEEEKEYDKDKYEKAFTDCPPYEEGKEDRLAEDAYEYFFRHLAEEGWIPTRLETDLKHRREQLAKKPDT